jgi:SNF2 family DNA or RNA helicase
MNAADLKTLAPERLEEVDLVVTSYGSLLRMPWIAEASWQLVVLDEAQAIKNPDAKQTRAAKKLKAKSRFALTGTPIENRLGDLWSIFDFLNPGLLGSAKEFTRFTKHLAERSYNPYAPLRELLRPYILRRLKTDKTVISDLPEKIEVKAFCQLTRKQAALYQQSVEELAGLLDNTEGIQRKGLILSFLTRFKQICNHPSQWLSDGAWSEADSGKWARLREIAEVIAAKQEKVLVFTQFREVTAPLAAFLGSLFGRPGLVLHGLCGASRRMNPSDSSCFHSKPGARASILQQPLTSCISIDGGIRLWKTRPRTALFVLDKARTCWYTSSCAGERSRKRSTR